MSVSLTKPAVRRTIAGPARRVAPRLLGSIACLVVLAVLGQAEASKAVGDEPAPPATAAQAGADQPKPSQYAPAADLVEQAEYYIGRLSEALASEKDFDKDLQKRSKNDVHTLSAIVLVLAKHDQPSKLQSAALLPAVRQMGEVIDDYAKAAAALAEVKRAASQEGPPAAEVAWQPVAPLSALMQQVPIVNGALRRGLEANRFKRQQKQSAAQSATLAAIAQAAAYDLSAADDDTAAQWRTLCREMRDVAGRINQAVHGDDLSGAQAGAKTLAQNCDACHEAFRGGK